MAKDEGFFLKVYQVARQIPAGRVTSYGAIARYLGAPGAARMVGWALNQCGSQKEFVPAHRVVNRNGLLTGKHHFQGRKLMEELLLSEGLAVDNDRILDFREKFWDPLLELDL